MTSVLAATAVATTGWLLVGRVQSSATCTKRRSDREGALAAFFHPGKPVRVLMFPAIYRSFCKEKFPRSVPGETPAQFSRRMAKVQAWLNSEDFATPAGGGLAALARSLRTRCSSLLELEGGRLRI